MDQEAVGLLCSKGALLIHLELVHQDCQVLFCKAASGQPAACASVWCYSFPSAGVVTFLCRSSLGSSLPISQGWCGASEWQHNNLLGTMWQFLHEVQHLSPWQAVNLLKQHARWEMEDFIQGRRESPTATTHCFLGVWLLSSISATLAAPIKGKAVNTQAVRI